MKKVLTIAGSDTCGGAGIQADIKTMTAHGVYAMSAVTALTAQNTLGVRGILEVPPAFLAQQIDAIFEDIVPDAVKIGMLASAALGEVTAERLSAHSAKNIVVDPVMLATSGAVLLQEEAKHILLHRLFPMATLVTPNIPEAEAIMGEKIHGEGDMAGAAEAIGKAYGCAVLVKGGHGEEDAADVLYADGKCIWFREKRIENPNTHGTGCTLSSAIASNLAKGFSLEGAVRKGKAYISGALFFGLDIGKGAGPLYHAFNLKSDFMEEKEDRKEF